MLTRPVIAVVEDDPQSLVALQDALVRRFGSDYRMVSHLSARTALEDLERMRDDGERVALVVADQWMPEMTGIELLGRAHDIHATAQRALLVGQGRRGAGRRQLGGSGRRASVEERPPGDPRRARRVTRDEHV